MKRLVKLDAEGYLSESAPLTEEHLYKTGLQKKTVQVRLGVDAADGNKPVFRNKVVDDIETALAGGLVSGWQLAEWDSPEKPIWNRLVGYTKLVNGKLVVDETKKAEVEASRVTVQKSTEKEIFQRRAVKAAVEADKAAAMGLTDLETKLRAEVATQLAEADKV